MGNKHVGSSLYEFLQEEVFWKRPALSRSRKWSHGAVTIRCTSSMTAPTTSSVDGSTTAPTKAKGRFLSRDLALSVPIFGDPVLVPDHNACYPGIIRHPRAEARVFLTLLRSHSLQELSDRRPSPVAGPSLVADSRSRLSVRPLLWKIALPLKAILLSTSSNASGPCNFPLWK
jgi:hypothetical protein